MKILTFDIEDWYHLLDNPSTKTEVNWHNFESRIHENVNRILDLLDEKGLNATFFCLGWMVKKHPNVIKEIHKRGHGLGSHGQMHQLVYEQGLNLFRKDLDVSIKSLEDLTGEKIKYYRAPGFSITKSSLWAFEILHEAGIEIDCSIFPSSRAHGGFSNYGSAQPAIIDFGGATIKELPINLVSILGRKIIFSGGGYFRLFPYPIIRNWTRKSDYIMTYFHPRDFDPSQPIVSELSFTRKLKSYVGLKTSERKLDKWLSEFKFIDVKKADELINWPDVRTLCVYGQKSNHETIKLNTHNITSENIITASIVLFNTSESELKKIHKCIFQNIIISNLILIDNSPDDRLRNVIIHDRVQYIFSGKNIGYGKGHNIALKEILNKSEFHLVLNSDITFSSKVIPTLTSFIAKNSDIGLILPKILSKNGDVQYLCKLIPTPLNLILRLPMLLSLFKSKRSRYQLEFTGYNNTMESPCLSGCFMFLRVAALKEVGLFDERYFLYAEDIDLSRRIQEKYKTTYYPEVEIIHYHSKESFKNKKLMMVHISSIIKYFNKWGWFFDKKRKKTNKRILRQLNYKV